jgi:protein transport protein SEC61 subunit gamma-like protein
MSDVNAVIVQPLKQFVKDSVHLVKKCTKPDRKEFTRIAWATGVGFLIMGAPPRPAMCAGVGAHGWARARDGRRADRAARLDRLRRPGRPRARAPLRRPPRRGRSPRPPPTAHAPRS